MLNTVLLQLLLAGNVNAPSPLDLHDAKSSTTWQCVTALRDPDPHTKKGETDPKYGEGNENDLKKHDPISSDKKRVSDLSPPKEKPLVGGWLQVSDGAEKLLVADRESSLHPEHDPNSASYSGRSAPGPDHGPDPRGPDPHDEIHDSKLPANEHKDDGYPSKDPYNGSVPNGSTPY